MQGAGVARGAGYGCWCTGKCGTTHVERIVSAIHFCRLIVGERRAARRFDWDHYLKWKSDRAAYIRIHKQKQRGACTAQDEALHHRVEMDLHVEDLIDFRKAAYAELEAEAHSNPLPRPSQGWLSWVWGGSAPQEEGLEDMTASEVTEQLLEVILP